VFTSKTPLKSIPQHLKTSLIQLLISPEAGNMV